MKLKLPLALGILITSLFFNACNDKEEIKPVETTKKQVNVSYFVSAATIAKKGFSVKTLAVDSSAIPFVTWSTATIYVENISLSSNGTQPIDTTIIVNKKIDLFGADVLAGVFKMPTGSYNNVKVKMKLRKSPQSDFGFQLNGTFKGSNNKIYNLQLGTSDVFEVNVTVANFIADSSQDIKVAFSFDIERILKGITPQMLQMYPNTYFPSDIYIHASGSSVSPLFSQIASNWQRIAKVTFSNSVGEVVYIY